MDVIPKGCLKGIGIPTESLWRGELLRPKSQWSTGKRCLPKDGERSGGSEELCKELKRPAKEKDQESALTAAKPESSVGPSQKCQHAGAFLGLGSPLSPILSPVVVRHSTSEQLRKEERQGGRTEESVSSLAVCCRPVFCARLLGLQYSWRGRSHLAPRLDKREDTASLWGWWSGMMDRAWTPFCQTCVMWAHCYGLLVHAPKYIHNSYIVH